MDSKQAALTAIGVIGGFGFLVVSCSDTPPESAKHGHDDAHQSVEVAPHASADKAAHDPSGNAAHDHGKADKKDHSTWSYTGAGAPQHWAALSKDYAACNGKQQSPIDFSNVTVASLPAIEFDYKENALEITNTGDTIQVSYAPGSAMVLDGKRYELLYIDFHTPSEHTVGGQGYAMEGHLIHKASDGEHSIVGIMFKSGGTNNAIAKLWLNMPEKSGESSKPGNVYFNATDLLPDNTNYFNYTGSFTTPPCGEGVKWMVLTTPSQIAKAQLKQFSQLFPSNARPVQALNGREVKVSH